MKFDSFGKTAFRGRALQPVLNRFYSKPVTFYGLTSEINFWLILLAPLSENFSSFLSQGGVTAETSSVSGRF